jgi:hypothetical protein
MKYIVEFNEVYKNLVVVRADSEEQAKQIALEADANFQRYLGPTETTVREYTEEEKEELKHLDYFWEGFIGLDKDGKIHYYNGM